MLKLFKNFFFSKRFSKPTIISIVLVSVILGLILPIQSVYALVGMDWWEAALGPPGIIIRIARAIFGGAESEIVNGIILAIFAVLNAIALVFIFACSALLNWVMSPKFINVSFTQNEFVMAGWTIIRNLTNIAIVLGLVVIALATILRISTYHAKKTLPLLLIVALLVNFSPVICGIIIDGSNIVMNYFLKVGGLDTGFIELVKEQMGELYQTAKGETAANTLAVGIVLVGFNIFAGLIFLLYAFLFVFRYIALWILVILSPLAFFCYVFPYTQKWWQAWWNQFLAWCIIGIPAAFSIFLANQMIGLIAAKKLIGEVPGGALTTFATIMGYIVPLAFLVGGLFMAMKTGAMGADIAIAGFKWTAGKGIPWVAKGAGAGAAGALAEAKERKGWGKLTGIGKGLFTYPGHEKGREATARMLEAAHLVRPGFYEETRRKRWKLDEEIKRFKKFDTDELHKIMARVAITPADVRAKAAVFEVLSKGRKLKEEERKFLPTAKTYGVDTGETLKAMPHWAPDIGKAIGEQVEGRSRSQFRQEVQPQALRDVSVIINMDVSKLRDIELRGTEEQRRAIAETYNTFRSRINSARLAHRAAGERERERGIRDLMVELETSPTFTRYY